MDGLLQDRLDFVLAAVSMGMEELERAREAVNGHVVRMHLDKAVRFLETAELEDPFGYAEGSRVGELVEGVFGVAV